MDSLAASRGPVAICQKACQLGVERLLVYMVTLETKWLDPKFAKRLHVLLLLFV